MSAALDMNKLAEAISDRLTRKLPLEIDLWGSEQIADYLKVTKRQVAERYAAQPGFPKPIRLPSEKGRGHMRWKAAEVIRWAEGLEEGQ